LLLIFRCKPDNPKSRKFLGEKVRVFSATWLFSRQSRLTFE
jgi:hypothetical protein